MARNNDNSIPAPIPQPSVTDFNPRRYKSGRIYPLQNQLRRGYGVTGSDTDPGKRSANARFINIKGEKIDFYIEEMSANFSMAGTTGQSHHVRQFFPHNMVQPSITITGRAPNSYQYNRLSAFIRVGQDTGLSGQALRNAGIPLRNIPNAKQGPTLIPTLRLLIRRGVGGSSIRGGGRFPYEGRTVKGSHQAWRLEGYVKSMPAGAKHFEYAPQFTFEFLIAESQGPRQGDPNVGIWKDIAVAGDEIKPWIDIFQSGKRRTRGFEKNTGNALSEKIIDDVFSIF